MWGWPWARGAPQNFGFPYNISATAVVSDFKFGAHLRFAKAYHKHYTQKKRWAWLWAWVGDFLWRVNYLGM